MKYLLYAGLICLLILSLAGCGGGEEESTPKPPPDEMQLPPEPGQPGPGSQLIQPGAAIDVAAITPVGYLG